MRPKNTKVALDIETSGLDPSTDRVLAVAIDTDGDEPRSLISENERELLQWVNELIESLPDDTEIITWNGEEFDLPFLRRRFDKHNISTTLELRPRGTLGKYGGSLFRARWAGKHHCDIAPEFKEVADRYAVEWSLKPVAKAVLHVLPVEVDRRGESISSLDRESLRAYVESDASITLDLFRWLNSRVTERTTATN